MTLGLVLAALCLAAIGAALVPWRVGLALRVEGDPNGAWAAGGGVELSVISISVAAARGTPIVVELRAFGKRLVRRMIQPGAKKPELLPKEKEESLVERPSVLDRYRRFSRRIDPIDLLIFLAGERRRIAFEDLQGTVRLGLTDVALAGQIAGALAIVSALCSPFGHLEYALDWSGREHLQAGGSLAVRFSPGLLVVDTIRFVIRSVRLRNKPSPAPASV